MPTLPARVHLAGTGMQPVCVLPGNPERFYNRIKVVTLRGDITCKRCLSRLRKGVAK